MEKIYCLTSNSTGEILLNKEGEVETFNLADAVKKYLELNGEYDLTLFNYYDVVNYNIALDLLLSLGLYNYTNKLNADKQTYCISCESEQSFDLTSLLLTCDKAVNVHREVITDGPDCVYFELANRIAPFYAS